MRVAFEKELAYASEFPFVDYGIDLALMAKFEKGVMMTKLSVKPTDSDKVDSPRRITQEMKEDT